jgi:putative two-component system response regulator
VEAELRVRNLLAARRHEVALAHRGDELEAEVRARTRQLDASRLEVLDRLALAAEYRDDATGEHTRRVARTSRALADALGLAAGEAELVALAAPLHDIGKIGIPDGILRKAGRLEANEQEIMRRHTIIGGRMLAESDSPVLCLAQDVALRHHERWDGRGYPDGLGGEEIPQAARIVAVADVFDALLCARPYKDAWPLEQAVGVVLGEAGGHFDPDVVRAFATLDHQGLAPGRFPPGGRRPLLGEQEVAAPPPARVRRRRSD